MTLPTLPPHDQSCFFSGKSDNKNMVLPALPNHTHLTTGEVALFLRVHVRTVYRLIENDQLPFVRWGHVLRISRVEFILWYQRYSRSLPMSENKL